MIAQLVASRLVAALLLVGGLALAGCSDAPARSGSAAAPASDVALATRPPTPGAATGDAAGQAPGDAAGQARGETLEDTRAPHPAPEPPPTAGVARFASETHDFAEIDDTRTVSCTFPFVNAGTTTLNVLEVKASCGCTTTELKQRSFEPGAGDVIRVDWKPKGTGQQTQTVDVVTDSTVRRATRLTVRALVDPRVRAEPATATFGDVQAGTTQRTTIALTTSTPGIAVLGVAGGVDQLRATFVPAGAEAPAGLLGVVEVELLPIERRGSFATIFTVTMNVPADDAAPERTHELHVPVRASIHGAVRTQPDGFYVGHVKPSGTIDFKLRLRRPDGAPFGMTHAAVATCTVDGLTIDVEPGTDDAGAFVDLFLRGAVGDYLGTLRGQATLTTDIEGDGSFDLPIMGMVRE